MSLPKTCATCGGEIHYAGRRDLLLSVECAEKLLRKLAHGAEHPDPRVPLAMAWAVLHGALCDAAGRCRECTALLVQAEGL